jgi:hypothetical protein
MRKLPYLIALIGIGYASFANPSLASPLASGMLDNRASSVTDSWVQKVQAWSCQEKLRDMTIQQRRNCHGYGGPGYGYGYHGYGYGNGHPGYGYGYPGYGLGVAPFIGLSFYDDDYDHHHWRRHHRRHY